MVPDDGSVESKRYSVDFLINLSFHLEFRLPCYEFFYIEQVLAATP